MALLEVQIRGALKDMLHTEGVKALVGLGTKRLHSRPLGGVEQTDLDKGAICIAPHLTAKGIDLSNELPLARPPHARVAGHLRDQVQIHGYQKGPPAHAGRRQSRLTTGMASADNDHFIRTCNQVSAMGRC